jgi:hypothetical protein
MASKKIYVIAATFQEKYIIRFVVCSRVTESRDIAFAWEEIRTQADQLLSENIDHETERPAHRNQHGTAKEAPVIRNGIGSKIKGTHDAESENFPATKTSRFVHEDKDLRIEASKETLLPRYSNGVPLLPDTSNEVKALPNGNNALTLIQAEAVVLDNGCIQQVSNKTKSGAAINILAKDLLQQVLNGNGEKRSDFSTF